VTAPRDIKLLISDVDGTLVPYDKTLSADARAAAADLHRAGVGLALTSSRPPQGMRMLIEPLGLDLPLAGFNGGLIVDTKLNEIESHPIAPAAVEAALRMLKDSGLDVWIYADTGWFVTRADGPHVARESWIVQLDPKIAAPAANGALGRVFKIVGVSDDYPKVAAVEAAVQRQLDGVASVFRSADHFLDVTDLKATKGCVALSLARRLNLSRAQIASIGDSPNDVSMFRESGFSIAMGNASDEVKASADAVTDSNEHDGFAKAVRRFVLSLEPTEAEDRSPS
jgi:Cof subfamily protein (haloacid dehalogenase superfamily)